MPAISKGDVVTLDIPSGMIVVITRSADVTETEIGTVYRVEGDAYWNGKWAGLENGRSGLGNFQIRAWNVTVVESSIADHPISYTTYQLARLYAELASQRAYLGQESGEEPLSPEKIQEKMRKAVRWVEETIGREELPAVEEIDGMIPGRERRW